MGLRDPTAGVQRIVDLVGLYGHRPFWPMTWHPLLKFGWRLYR